MPAPVLHLGATVMCAHAGQATPTNPVPRVLVSGQPVVTLVTQYVVVACSLTGSGAPPCLTGQWVAGAVRVLAAGAPLATMAGTSVTTPTGTPMLPVVSQLRVLAT